MQSGDLYRLQSAFGNDVSANQYVSADARQSAVFVFRHSQQYNTNPPAILLRGLDEKALYRIEPVTSNLREEAKELSGAALMGRGLQWELHADYDSAAVILERK